MADDPQNPGVAGDPRSVDDWLRSHGAEDDLHSADGRCQIRAVAGDPQSRGVVVRSADGSIRNPGVADDPHSVDGRC